MPKPSRSLTQNEFLLLLCLVEGGRHGYALKKAVAERTDGRVDLGPATLYRSLHRLLEDGLIGESAERPAPELDDERRRYYTLTDKGRREASAEPRRLAKLVEAARDARLIDERA